MGIFDRERLSERECEAAFAVLFPRGFGGVDVMNEVAPAGWDRSPLVAVFHPSIEQRYREAVQLHRNFERLFSARPTHRPRPEPTIEEVRADAREVPVEPDRELRELVGKCVWDIFSDNHEVLDADGRIVDIGSFRGAGGFVADLLNREAGSDTYDYMDFYMGTIWLSRRADLTPVYAMIFRRLSRLGFDWEYTFPRLYAIRLGDDAGDADDAERSETDRILEEGHRDALEEAKDRPPPETVQAYDQVHGCFPRGWPPWD